MQPPPNVRWGHVAMVLGLTAVSACKGAPRARLSATIEECDPAGYLQCIQDAAFLSVPVTNTGLSLTYSSYPPIDSAVQRLWAATGLGLGGWSINLVNRYDAKNNVLIQGDGAWHAASAAALPSGERVVPSYDGAVAYVFDSAGRHVRTVDGHLGTVLLSISYDPAGRVLQVDGSRGNQPVHVTVQRGPDGVARGLVGTDGGTTTLDMDGTGHLTGITDPAGGRTQIAWGQNGRVASLTDPLGSATQYSYNDAGDLLSITDADSVTRHYERQTLRSGFEVRVTTDLGRQWMYRAESVSNGIRRTLVAPDGSTTTESVDPHGDRVIRAADGTQLRVGAVEGSIWGAAAPTLTPIVETRPDGVSSRGEVKDALQPQHGLPYVVAGSVTMTINGRPWIATYDPDGRTETLADPMGRRTTNTFDANGRLLRRSAPGSAGLSYTYDAQGHVASETKGTGAQLETTTYKYDTATGRVTMTRADGTTEVITYDKAGRPLSASAGDGSMSQAGYDAAGRLTLLAPPGGVSFALGSSPAGRPTAFVPPFVANDSSIEITSYDRDGDVAAVAGLGRRAVNIIRDQAGRVTGVSFDRGKRSLAYDAHSALVTQTTDPSGVVTTHAYAGHVPDGLTWSGPVTGSVVEKLDADGRPTAEAVDASNPLSFAYDGSGNLIGVGPLSLTRDSSSGLVTHTALGVVETRQQFDANARLVRATTVASGQTLLDQRYAYDALGRVKTVIETMDGTTATTDYSYDRAGRLGAVRLNGHLMETASYDGAGNRVGVARPTGGVNATYDSRHRAINWGPVRYSWSAAGSLERQSDGAHATALKYDDFGSLREATPPDGRTITYLVDAEGRRVGRMVAGKLVAGYLYRLDGAIAAEVDSTGAIVARFGYDDVGHLSLVERGGVTYRVITDQIGSPHLLIDSRNGTVTDAIAYDAWGTVTRDAAPGFLPIGFAGGLRDPGTGLIRFGARDYDPASGRWTAADPIRFGGGDANLYRYAGGDPVNVVDRTGMFIPIIAPGFWVPFMGPAAVLGLGAGLGYGAGWLYNHFFPSDPGGNSPGGNNPPGAGNPPGSNPPPKGQQPWNCISETGTCGDPGQAPGPDGRPQWGCQWGSCGNNGNGFWCHATWCWGPNSDLCKAAIGSKCSYGDTHLRVNRDVSLDFQALGEFLAAASPDGQFVVQARQETFFAASQVAFNTAVAATVNGDRVGVYAREPSFLLINDTPTSELEFERRLPHGGTLQRRGGTVTVEWPDGSRLMIVQIGNTLNYGFVPSASIARSVRGLLPNADTSGSHALVGRDATTLSMADPAFQTKLYQQYGASWRIKASESLFHYWPGESTAGFTNLSFPTQPVTVASLPAATRATAEGICRAVGVVREPTLDDCILDVGVTGAPAMAAASVAAAADPVTAAPTAPDQLAPSGGANVFALKIGDTVSADHPAPGAGTATPARGKQTYTFEARPGEIIYADVGPCQGALFSFDVVDSANHYLGGVAGCKDIGPITLPTAGVYRVIVTSDRQAGRYAFSLRATTFDQYMIKIGDTVASGRPAAGAGVIAHPGERQAYSFDARAGQIIFVQVGPCAGTGVTFDVRDPADHSIGSKNGCNGFGPITLTSTGTHRIVVDAGTGTSTYAFTLRPTTLDTYTISIGDSVSPNHPAAGAGTIAQLGQRQSYAFQARAGQAIYLGIGPCQGGLGLDVIAPDNGLVDLQIGCHDLGRVVLPRAGTYHIIAHTDNPTVQYAFVVRGIPADQHFGVSIPVAVAPDAPSREAGRIASQGAQQFYDFTGRPGAVVHLEGKRGAPCPNLVVRVTKVGDASRFGFSDVMGLKQDWTLPEGNQYTIQVRSNGYVGNYGFAASVGKNK